MDLDASVALRAQSQDWAGLLRLICKHGTGVLAQGRAKALRQWVAVFPAQFAANVPWVTYWSGAATIAESPAAARSLLGKAYRAFETQGDAVGQLLSAAGVLETYQFEWMSFEAARDWIVRLEACWAREAFLECRETELRVLANWLFARTHFDPKLEPSVSCMARIRPLLHSAIDVNQRLFAARSVLLALCSRADLEAVQAQAARMGLMLEEPGCTPLSRVLALSAIAHSLWLSGAFEEAGVVVQEVIRTSTEGEVRLIDPLHHQVRQLLSFSLADSTETLESIFALQRSIHPACHYGMSMLKCALVQQAMMQGSHRSALTHAVAAVCRADKASAADAQVITRLALSLVLALQSDHAEATRILQEAGDLVERDPWELARRDYELVAAYLALKRADTVGCHALLTRSLHSLPVASQVFARFPRQMADLCTEALRSGIAVDVVHELVRRYRLRGRRALWPRAFRALRAVS